jgi:SAM-dependent methyltransferase
MSDREFDAEATARWYDRHSESYDEETFRQDDDNYGGDLYRIQLISQLLPELGARRILDAGCGTAEPLLALLRLGLDARGFDFSEGMVRQAKRKLSQNGFDPELAQVADVTDMEIVSRFGAGAYDCVVANGILPYVEDLESAHRNLAALVKPGGHFVSAYSNELFNLSTLNRFTVDFHRRNFIENLSAVSSVKEELAAGVEALLARPDEPREIEHSARDQVYLRADNPLSIGEDLRCFGLEQVDIMFYKYHAFAPLLRDVSENVRKIFVGQSRAYEVDRARDWRGYFLASTFIIVCRKVAD